MLQVEIIQNHKWEWDILAREHFLITDISDETGGNNEGPMPEEIFLAAIGASIGHKITEFLEKNELDIKDGFKLICEAEKAENPERLESIKVNIEFPVSFPYKFKQKIISYAEKNVINNTILFAPIIEISENYGG